jgi:hypothetical protein
LPTAHFHITYIRIQRYIVRILFVCPVYALGSLLSLCVPSAASAMETIRDMMEAFVIYSFLALVLEYAGGERTMPRRPPAATMLCDREPPP